MAQVETFTDPSSGISLQKGPAFSRVWVRRLLKQVEKLGSLSFLACALLMRGISIMFRLLGAAMTAGSFG